MNEKELNYTNLRNNTLNAKMETDKKYAIIKMGSFLTTTAGLGHYIIYILRGIRFAVENEYIPVIDWQNCKLPQYNPSEMGKRNVWELFFEQPFNIGIEEAYKSGNFFVIDDIRSFLNKEKYFGICSDKMADFHHKDIGIWRHFFHKYIRIRKDVQEYFEERRLKQFQSYEGVIGILARGTDYRDLRPVGHMKPIMTEEIFSLVDQLIDENEDEKIYLATEDQRILEEFQKKYPGRILFVETKRYADLGSNTLNVTYRGENGYTRDLQYLYSLYVISKCGKGIYSACGGGIIASLMREEIGAAYHFLYNGVNRAKGIIVGSFLEKKCRNAIMMGRKPVMYYALNTLKLLGVRDVDILVSESVRNSYQELIGQGNDFGMDITYVESDDYNVADYMAHSPNFITSSKTVVLYADFFSYGKDIGKELANKVNEFDGACAWGKKLDFPLDVEGIKLNKDTEMPEEVFELCRESFFGLMGKYVFDYELNDILVMLSKDKKKITLVDILNEYIRRKKLFLNEYQRGIVYTCIKRQEWLDKTGQMIELMEELQGQTIGDFERFRLTEGGKK